MEQEEEALLVAHGRNIQLGQAQDGRLDVAILVRVGPLICRRTIGIHPGPASV